MVRLEELEPTVGTPMLIANQLTLWSRTLVSKRFANSGTDGPYIVRGRAEPDLLGRLGNASLSTASIAPKDAAVKGNEKGGQRAPSRLAGLSE